MTMMLFGVVGAVWDGVEGVVTQETFRTANAAEQAVRGGQVDSARGGPRSVPEPPGCQPAERYQIPRAPDLARREDLCYTHTRSGESVAPT